MKEYLARELPNQKILRKNTKKEMDTVTAKLETEIQEEIKRMTDQGLDPIKDSDIIRLMIQNREDQYRKDCSRILDGMIRVFRYEDQKIVSAMREPTILSKGFMDELEDSFQTITTILAKMNQGVTLSHIDFKSLEIQAVKGNGYDTLSPHEISEKLAYGERMFAKLSAVVNSVYNMEQMRNVTEVSFAIVDYYLQSMFKMI